MVSCDWQQGDDHPALERLAYPERMRADYTGGYAQGSSKAENSDAALLSSCNHARFLGRMEARAGIEPACKDLQSSA
jgi:hypothetical protein